MKVAQQRDSPPQPEKEASSDAAGELKPDGDKDKDPLDRLRDRVFQPLKKKIYQPLNRLVDRLGYVSAALLLLGITGIGALVIHVWNDPAKAQSEITMARYYFDARKLTPPQDPAAFEAIRDLTNQLKDFIAPSNRGSGKGEYGSWEAAQMIVSLQGQDSFDPVEMSQWLVVNEGNCHCWNAADQSGGDQYGHLGNTGWVLLAFARMSAKPTEQAIEFVLNNQHQPGGWWSTYPSTNDPRNAAIYPTAYCTWALAELLRRNLISDAQKSRATDAVVKGRKWLLNNAIPGQPGRWKDYPNGGYGTESLGASGLVLHVLHNTPGDQPSDSDRNWMQNLPAELPMPRDEVSSGQTVEISKHKWRSDATHHFTFPWLIIATKDAYSQGTLIQRAQAARLIHQIGEKREAIATECKDMPWLAAETLIALRYLRGDDVI